MMEARFEMGGVADDRIFQNVVSVETGEYEHGNEATVEQYFEGDLERFPVRGYEDVQVEVQVRPGADR